MKIGMTYDLREDYLQRGFDEEATAEFDSPETIQAIELELAELGHAPERIGGIHNLTARLVAGDRWDLVFNIAEGLVGPGRESQVPALLEAYEVPFTFSDAAVLSLSLHKAFCKYAVRGMGIATADFAVVHNELDALAVELPLPLFVKPIGEGTSKGISARSKIDSREALIVECADLLSRFHQPVLVERFLPGREFTVGILGTGAEAVDLGVLEVLLMQGAEANVYSYANKQDYEAVVTYELATDSVALAAREMALAAWRGIGCRDAGRVDLRCDDEGNPVFLEVNPLAGLHPRHSDLSIMCRMRGLPYGHIIERIVSSAMSRVPAARPVVEGSKHGAS